MYVYIHLCRHAWADLKHCHALYHSKIPAAVLYQLPMSVISETGFYGDKTRNFVPFAIATGS